MREENEIVEESPTQKDFVASYILLLEVVTGLLVERAQEGDVTIESLADRFARNIVIQAACRQRLKTEVTH